MNGQKIRVFLLTLSRDKLNSYCNNNGLFDLAATAILDTQSTYAYMRIEPK